MYSPRLIIKDWWIAVSAAVCFLVQVYLWWYLSTSVPPAPGQFFLHYNSVFGVDLVGPWWRIFVMPLVGLVIFIINFTLGMLLYHKDRFLSRSLAVMAALLHLALVITVQMLGSLNT